MHGYSTVDRDEDQTNFSNRWMDINGDRHPDSMEMCMAIFFQEYDHVWPELMDKLESWIVENDAKLEATK